MCLPLCLLSFLVFSIQVSVKAQRVACRRLFVCGGGEGSVGMCKTNVGGCVYTCVCVSFSDPTKSKTTWVVDEDEASYTLYCLLLDAAHHSRECGRTS